MQDNELMALIIEIISAQATDAGIAGVPVRQAYQPTNQGVSSTASAYLFKILDYRVGAPEKTDFYDDGTNEIVHRESQWIETTFQFSALAPYANTTPPPPTAGDILGSIAYILQSEDGIAAFQAQGVGVQKIGQIVNSLVPKDKGGYESAPFFDIVLSHKKTIENRKIVVESIETKLVSV